MNWYALFVESGKEDLVSRLLGEAQILTPINSFIPKKLVPEKKNGDFKDVLKILFPGYVFIQTLLTPDIYYNIRNIPKVHYFVYTGKYKQDQSYSWYSRIANHEMNNILALVDQDGVVRYSRIDIVDKQVKVLEGPLEGKEELIKKVDKRKRRAKIELNLMGESRTLDVGVHISDKSCYLDT